jgi:predicted SAM-dependent methyltransferase
MNVTRVAVDAITMFLCRLNKNRKVVPKAVNGFVKVNLGCGSSVAPGWSNIDGSLNSLVSKWPALLQKISFRFSGSKQFYSFDQYHAILSDNIFIHHNLEYGIPLPDQCVDFLYSSHFLEHLKPNVAKRLLREAYRALKPNGLIRLVVPDLGFAIKLYCQGDKIRMLNNYFFVDQDDSFFAAHKYMYDWDLLKFALEEAGFCSIRQYSFQEGELPDLSILDNRPEDSLYVEARK